jgi:hypothetical protein
MQVDRADLRGKSGDGQVLITSENHVDELAAAIGNTLYPYRSQARDQQLRLPRRRRLEPRGPKGSVVRVVCGDEVGEGCGVHSCRLVRRGRKCKKFPAGLSGYVAFAAFRLARFAAFVLVTLAFVALLPPAFACSKQ